MKTFPRFSDATILHDISQPQAKLILMALNAFSDALEGQSLQIEIKPLLERCMRSYEFNLPSHYLDNSETLKNHVHALIDSISNAYVDARETHIRMASESLTEHYNENFEPDVFNLASGEILRIAGHEYN